MKTLSNELIDRSLRFDGVSVVDPVDVSRFLLLGIPPRQLRVTRESPEIAQFNQHVVSEDELKLAEQEPVVLDFSWQIPESYLKIDLRTYFIDAFIKRNLSYTETQVELAAERIEAELKEVDRRGMTQFMQTIIYILDVLREKDVVWGVGRGSSCACYLLFILGLHSVDCLLLDIPLDEFFHE